MSLVVVRCLLVAVSLFVVGGVPLGVCCVLVDVVPCLWFLVGCCLLIVARCASFVVRCLLCCCC